MYTVSLFARGQEHVRGFHTEDAAIEFAKCYWNLAPIIRDPAGKQIVQRPAANVIDSEY